MSKKSEFIEYVNALIRNQEEPIEMSDNVRTYWEALIGGNGVDDKPMFTDNGKLIMSYLQSLPDGTPMMKAKDIAEGMCIGSRAVSGAMRKLVEDGYVEKVGKDPVMYALTEKGKTIKLD